MRKLILLMAFNASIALMKNSETSPPKLLEVPLIRKHLTNDTQSSLLQTQKRSLAGRFFSANQERITQGKLVEKNLLNYYNVQYYGSLFIGSEQREMNFIFDTGSSWLWLPTKDCDECHASAKPYDYSTSLSYKQVESVPQHIQYGGGSVWGHRAQDQVCLDKRQVNSCIMNHNFLSVFVTSELEGLQCDGILGLAPSPQSTSSDLFVDKLKKEGIIDRRMFSFSLGGSDEQSKVIFGGYDMQYAKANQTITWNNLIDDNYWTVRLMDARIGDYQFKLDTNKAIIDTGTSYILMPQNDFDEFRRIIEPGRKCTFDYGQTNLFTCQCITETHSDFPDMEIKLGENVYRIPSTSYMTRQKFKCYFKVMAQHFNGEEFWILGDAFLLNYYSIFDLDKKAVGLIGSVHVEKISYWMDILLVASLLMAAIGILAFLVSCYKEKKVCQIIHESEMSTVSNYNPVSINRNNGPVQVTSTNVNDRYGQGV